MIEQRTQPCPKCGGRGKTEGFVIVCTRSAAGAMTSRRTLTCRGCDDTGSVSVERLRDMEQGQKDRTERVHGNYRTMRERARELGIDEVQLSRWENYGIRWEGKR